MTTNSRERRPQLVRHGHEEIAFQPVGLLEPDRHLIEAVGQVSDLAAAADRRDRDVVTALGDLVGRLGKPQHRLDDSA
jgi:hypothetical protein